MLIKLSSLLRVKKVSPPTRHFKNWDATNCSVKYTSTSHNKTLGQSKRSFRPTITQYSPGAAFITNFQGDKKKIISIKIT